MSGDSIKNNLIGIIWKHILIKWCLYTPKHYCRSVKWTFSHKLLVTTSPCRKNYVYINTNLHISLQKLRENSCSKYRYKNSTCFLRTCWASLITANLFNILTATHHVYTLKYLYIHFNLRLKQFIVKDKAAWNSV